MTTTEQILLNIDQVAIRLGFSVRTVKGWLREGKLPGIKIGSRWRVRSTDLSEYVTSLDRVNKNKQISEELSFDEIGHVLGKPLNTVKSRYRRGVIILKKVLGDNFK